MFQKSGTEVLEQRSGVILYPALRKTRFSKKKVFFVVNDILPPFGGRI